MCDGFPVEVIAVDVAAVVTPDVVVIYVRYVYNCCWCCGYVALAVFNVFPDALIGNSSTVVIGVTAVIVIVAVVVVIDVVVAVVVIVVVDQKFEAASFNADFRF